MSSVGAARFCGREVTSSELELIRGVVRTCAGLSRMELAQTVCELLDWRRPNGSLKARECWEFLEVLDAQGELALPALRRTKPRGAKTRVPRTSRGAAQEPLKGEVSQFGPISLTRVEKQSDRLLWRELVQRYHYLGHKVPFGAHLRYLIHVAEPQLRVVGCLQFSSPAWRMAARDRWIGWDDATRASNLQQIVNNSRFLILPWVGIRNLASTVLSQAARCISRDWQGAYAVRPLLLETLVDASRFAGTCYRAANWIEVGATTGRGRMDQAHQRHGAAPKTIFLYPLVRDVQVRLKEI